MRPDGQLKYALSTVKARSQVGTSRVFGLEKGRVYPHQAARALLNPLRRLIVSPDRLVRWMGVRADDRVLELGCGPGYFSPTLVRAAATGTVVLFDVQREMLQMARDRAAGVGTCQLVQGDALALPFAAASFDRVLMVTVLGETGDPGACLLEIHRVLSPGGCLVNVEQRGDTDRIDRPEMVRLAGAAGLMIQREWSGGLGLSRGIELVAV